MIARECGTCVHWRAPSAPDPRWSPEFVEKYGRFGECEKITAASAGPGVRAYATSCCCGESLQTVAHFGCVLYEAPPPAPKPQRCGCSWCQRQADARVWSAPVPGADPVVTE